MTTVNVAVPPSSDMVNAAIKVAGTRSEAAKYLLDAVQEKFAKFMDKQPVRDMVKMLESEFNKLIELEKYSPWPGVLPMKHSEALMQAVFDLANKSLSGEINLDLAIKTADGVSQFLRAYSVIDANTLAKIAASQDSVDAMDSLINSWLSENGIINIDGYLYDSDEKGEAKKDPNGEKKPVSVQDFNAKLSSKDRGLSKYLEVHAKSASVKVTNQSEGQAAPEQTKKGSEQPSDPGSGQI